MMSMKKHFLFKIFFSKGENQMNLDNKDNSLLNNLNRSISHIVNKLANVTSLNTDYWMNNRMKKLDPKQQNNILLKFLINRITQTTIVSKIYRQITRNNVYLLIVTLFNNKTKLI